MIWFETLIRVIPFEDRNFHLRSTQWPSWIWYIRQWPYLIELSYYSSALKRKLEEIETICGTKGWHDTQEPGLSIPTFWNSFHSTNIEKQYIFLSIFSSISWYYFLREPYLDSIMFLYAIHPSGGLFALPIVKRDAYINIMTVFCCWCLCYCYC